MCEGLKPTAELTVVRYTLCWALPERTGMPRSCARPHNTYHSGMHMQLTSEPSVHFSC